ncbi:MAG: hypothetical protein PVH30_05855 [Desulfobacterales bacterium]|jgi:hypothetical protein
MIRAMLLAWVVGFAAAGCVTYTGPIVRSNEARIYGIEEVLARDEVTEVDVLMIHGMCTHGRQWVQKSFNRLGERTGFIDAELDLAEVKKNELVLSARFTPGDILPGREEMPKGLEEIEHTAIYSHKFEKDGKTLWVHAILWSPSTEPLKKRLCYDITDRKSADGKKCQDAPAYPYKRASLNARFKDKLMNNCLSDVFIYLGENQKIIQKQVAMAIVYAAGVRSADSASWDPIIKRAREETTPVFIVAESLGCKVLFDTLVAMYTESIGRGDLIDEILESNSTSEKERNGVEKEKLVEAIENFFNRTEQIYLGGNQIPVLSLANESSFRDLVKNSRYPKNGGILNPKGGHPLPVAVFSDPNDILSYTFGYSGFGDITGISAVDVIVSNGRTWFGLFEWPGSAHEGYRDNPWVDEIIRCGYPRWRDCPEPPEN